MNSMNREVFGKVDAQALPKPILWRLMLPLSAIIFLMIALGGAIIYRQNKLLLDYRIRQNAERISAAFHAEVEDLAEGMNLALFSISSDPRVINAMINKDRETLFEDWHPVFQNMLNINSVNHFTFLDKDRVRLLRVHNPDQSSGIINRHTVLEAQRTGKPSWGIELEMGSREVPTLRCVFPVFHGRDLIGYVELGKDLENILNQVFKRTKSPLALLIDKQFVNREGWENTMRELGRDSNWERLSQNVIMYATDEVMPDRLINTVPQAKVKKNSSDLRLNTNGHRWHVSSLSLIDAKGRDIGCLLFMTDITEQVESFHNTIHIASAITGLLLIVLIGGVFLLLNYTDRGIRNQQLMLIESEDKFRNLVKNSPDRILTVTSEGIITFHNDSGEGDQYISEIGEKILSFVNKDDQQLFQTALDKVIKNHEKQEIEYRYNADYFKSRFVPLITSKDGTTAMIISSTITNEKQAELVIKQQSEKYNAILKATSSGFFMLDNNGNIIEANEAFMKITGYSKNELLNLTLADLNRLDNHKDTLLFIKNLIADGNVDFETIIHHKDGSEVFVRIRASHNSDMDEYLCFINDISNEKKYERRLKEINERFNLAETAGNVGVWDLNIETGQVYWSDNLKALIGYNTIGNYSDLDEFLKYIHPDDLPIVESNLATVIKNHDVWELEFRVLRNFVEVRWVYAKGNFIDDTQNDSSRILGITIDVTDRKNAEYEIEQKSDQLNALLRTTSEGLWIVDSHGRLKVVNQAYCMMSGYTQEELLNMTIADLEAVESPEQVAEHIRLTHKHGIDRFETKHKRKDGTTYDVSVSASIDLKRNELYGFIRDITEVKIAEQKLIETNNRFQLAEEAGSIGAWEWNALTDEAVWSDNAYKILGFKPGEVDVSLKGFEQLVFPPDRKAFFDTLTLALKEKNEFQMEFRLINKAGEPVWIKDNALIKRDENNKPLRLVGSLQDISERKQYEFLLRNSLDEKEILLKEIHHRVKNNLQVVSSMLYLQSLQIKDESVVDMFQLSLNRIKSMVLVHEYLYQSDDFRNIDFQQYVEELISVLKETYASQAVNIHMEAEVHTSVKFEQVIYCGLIINELLSNAIKYAFVGREKGAVWLKFYRNESFYYLEVIDNGVGIPDMAVVDNGNSLGVKILRALVEQLKGEMDYISDKGTKVVIKFPAG